MKGEPLAVDLAIAEKPHAECAESAELDLNGHPAEISLAKA